LLETFEDWTCALDQGYGIDVDYSKAFDSVPLLYKLEAYGICGNVLLWVSNFLSSRLQRVAFNGCLSNWVSVLSGVPQGSILGPLHSILYVNDIPDFIAKYHKDVCR